MLETYVLRVLPSHFPVKPLPRHWDLHRHSSPKASTTSLPPLSIGVMSIGVSLLGLAGSGALCEWLSQMVLGHSLEPNTITQILTITQIRRVFMWSKLRTKRVWPVQLLPIVCKLNAANLVATYSTVFHPWMRKAWMRKDCLLNRYRVLDEIEEVLTTWLTGKGAYHTFSVGD